METIAELFANCAPEHAFYLGMLVMMGFMMEVLYAAKLIDLIADGAVWLIKKFCYWLKNRIKH